MYFKDFKNEILERCGTYDDVFRLNDEGHESAYDAHVEMFHNGEFGSMTEMEFDLFCYEIGREFVLDNLGDIFQLKGNEND